MSMEQDCRERVKEEYRDLIKNLLEASGWSKINWTNSGVWVEGNLKTMSGLECTIYVLRFIRV